MKIVRQTETKSHCIRLVDDLPQYGGYFSVEVARKQDDGFLAWYREGELTSNIDEAIWKYEQIVKLKTNF